MSLLNFSKIDNVYECRGAKKEDVYKKFVEKEAKYHKKCYTQYDHNHFHQVPSPPIEKSSESFGPRFSKLFKRVSLLLRGMCALFATNQT